ncbi:MAG: proliferating cell nuclear antigen (pcna) [Candidatus Aenigmarchaeota archaeon]|nr:proliferating cell nuclear antigen (pcna) [Candidatus Aenigmarchaeota archaeon]
MFKIVMNNGELLKKSIPIIADIIDEGVFQINQNGMSLLCPDRTMVAVVDMTIPSSAFDEFTADGTHNIGVNMSSFVDVIKRIKPNDKVTLQSKDNRVLITLEGRGKRKFMLSLLDIQNEKPPIDQLKFAGSVQLNSEILEDSIADADIISDSLVIQAAPDIFRISTKGDTSSAELELKKGDEGLISMEAADSIRARYPLEYLKKMIKASKITDKVTIEFGNDYPMRLGFTDTDKISMRFILAPRVED